MNKTAQKILFAFALLIVFSLISATHNQKNNIYGYFSDATGYLINESIEGTAADTLFKVVEIVDGDTIKVDYYGQIASIRLIGIDSPEMANFGKTQQCFAMEATGFAEKFLKNQQVYLISDPTQADKDKYQRLLRYVILLDQTNFNMTVINQGYAFEYTYDEPYIYQEEFQKAEEYAKKNNLGLWDKDTCNGLKVAQD